MRNKEKMARKNEKRKKNNQKNVKENRQPASGQCVLHGLDELVEILSIACVKNVIT